MTDARIGVMPGDYIGPEVVAATIPVLDEIGRQADHAFEYVTIPASGDAYDMTGEHLPEQSIRASLETDAVLKGPFGGPPSSTDPKWQNLETSAILPLRTELGLFANLRPVNSNLSRLCVQLSSLKPEVIEGTDIMFVREFTGDVYYGKRDSGTTESGERYAYETGYYQEGQVRRIMEAAFKIAKERGDALTMVHKTNVLKETGSLWRDVFNEMAEEEPDVETRYMHVDAMAAALIRNPSVFGTVVSPNMFGDILTDQGTELIGSLGLGGSASLGDGSFGLYEPIHGSAPDIAGKNMSNPVGMMLSAGLMLRHSLGMPEEAAAVEKAVGATLDKGFLTPDLFSKASSPQLEDADVRQVTTSEFSEQVIEEVRAQA